MIESVLGNGITNGDQLAELASKLFGKQFRGVYGDYDVFPKLGLNEFVIINRRDGQHWITTANVGGKIYTYDSFNRPEYLGGFTSGDEDGKPDQLPYQTNCGQNCLAWLITVFSK